MVVFNQDLVNYRLKKDEILTVTGIEGDRVQLLHPDGGRRSIRPWGSIRYRLDVYETRPIEIRAGDRIRWTRNDKARTLINGERAEVTGIAGGRVRFRLEDGRSLSLKVDDPQLRHIDHAWSSTVHGGAGDYGGRGDRGAGLEPRRAHRPVDLLRRDQPGARPGGGAHRQPGRACRDARGEYRRTSDGDRGCRQGGSTSGSSRVRRSSPGCCRRRRRCGHRARNGPRWRRGHGARARCCSTWRATGR